jgi:hypothetical protein
VPAHAAEHELDGEGGQAAVALGLRERPLVVTELAQPSQESAAGVAAQLIFIPEIARAITSRWISEVPSKIV